MVKKFKVEILGAKVTVQGLLICWGSMESARSQEGR